VTFTLTQPGDYTIAEETRLDWTSIGPTSYDFTAESGVSYGPYTFTNFEHSDVTACKEDHTGQRLGGWTINLLDATGLEIAEGITSSNDGCVTFTITSPGDYSLTEDLKPGWIQSVPASGSFDFTATSGYQSTFIFVNISPSIDIDKQIRAYEDGAWKDHLTVIVGTPLYYQFVATNDGPIDLQDVEVTDPTLGEMFFSDPAHVFCTIDLLVAGESYTCPDVPLGPIPAEFTGMGSDYYPAFENTATAVGCAVPDPSLCVDDDDTASYEGLYWAFTPGFWKNHAYDAPSGNDAWLYTAYGSETGDYENVCAVFINAADYVDCENLLNTLRSMRGGRGTDGAAQILLRAGIAALLNASFHETIHDGLTGPNGEIYYPYSSAEVIALVNEALGSVDDEFMTAREKMLLLAAELDAYNNGIHFINWDDPYAPYIP
jgi:hypothetical protein